MRTKIFGSILQFLLTLIGAAVGSGLIIYWQLPKEQEYWEIKHNIEQSEQIRANKIGLLGELSREMAKLAWCEMEMYLIDSRSDTNHESTEKKRDLVKTEFDTFGKVMPIIMKIQQFYGSNVREKINEFANSSNKNDGDFSKTVTYQKIKEEISVYKIVFKNDIEEEKFIKALKLVYCLREVIQEMNAELANENKAI